MTTIIPSRVPAYVLLPASISVEICQRSTADILIPWIVTRRITAGRIGVGNHLNLFIQGSGEYKGTGVVKRIIFMEQDFIIFHIETDINFLVLPIRLAVLYQWTVLPLGEFLFHSRYFDQLPNTIPFTIPVHYPAKPNHPIIVTSSTERVTTILQEIDTESDVS